MSVDPLKIWQMDTVWLRAVEESLVDDKARTVEVTKHYFCP